MQVSVQFFAQLREQLGCQRVRIEVTDPASMKDVKDALARHFPDQADVFDSPLLMACNQQLVDGSHQVNASDELALFPPVTGG
ncbi:molybdopterin converting factor subunit 1 [Alteromonas sp. ASW11-19]|uniref:Molybdopterin synthase sulfur carrier subunit n=1 Tax=Alteromonas salexigens TaxID=2982530 RepID=A0ABT2VSC3_9ALTE|nr:molybdopterin converting factor subunit 1 [Alteromonas salexigens]MCU7555818.1 molybdopterin converting factor subunit 1 [Alteromonas salexigens]